MPQRCKNAAYPQSCMNDKAAFGKAFEKQASFHHKLAGAENSFSARPFLFPQPDAGFPSVVFPAPFFPTSPISCPLRIVAVTLQTAVLSLYFFVTFSKTSSMRHSFPSVSDSSVSGPSVSGFSARPGNSAGGLAGGSSRILCESPSSSSFVT